MFGKGLKFLGIACMLGVLAAAVPALADRTGAAVDPRAGPRSSSGESRGPEASPGDSAAGRQITAADAAACARPAPGAGSGGNRPRPALGGSHRRLGLRRLTDPQPALRGA